jgi:hypothetical protein
LRASEVFNRLGWHFKKIDFLKAPLKASIQFCLINVANNDQNMAKIVGCTLVEPSMGEEKEKFYLG